MSALEKAVQQLQLVEVFTCWQGDYEWAEFRAWRAPSGRFYWYGDSGCSCNGYADLDFRSEADFGDGDREALERAFRTWAQDNRSYCTAQDIIDGVERLRQL